MMQTATMNLHYEPVTSQLGLLLPELAIHGPADMRQWPKWAKSVWIFKLGKTSRALKFKHDCHVGKQPKSTEYVAAEVSPQNISLCLDPQIG